MRAFSSCIALGAFAFTLGSERLEAQDRRSAATPPRAAPTGDIRQSVVSVVGLGANGDTLIRGSGVVVGDSGLVATYGRFFTRDMSLIAVDASGNSARAQRVVVNDSSLDILLFQAPATRASIAVLSSRLVRAHERIRAVSAEPGRESSVTESAVGRVESFGGGSLAILVDSTNALALGAPMFNALGELVAIGFSAEEGAKITNYGVPAGDVQRLIARSAQPRVVARSDVAGVGATRSPSAEAPAPPTRTVAPAGTRGAPAPPPSPSRSTTTSRASSNAAGSLSRSSFNTAGLANAEVLTNLFTGDFEKIEFGRDDMMFSVIFQNYLDGCARHCAAQLPADKVEMTRQECATEQVTRNGYGTEVGRSCVEWRTVGRGLYADPRLYGALNQNDAQNIGNNLRSMFQMMASGNPLGKATQFASSAESYQNDMEQLVQLNACGNAAMKRFEANLVRFAQGKQPIRLDGESSAALAALPFRESNYGRLAEDLIAEDATKWAFNRFVAGSVSDVSVTSRDESGRPMKVFGRYRFQGMNGPASGTFELAFNDGTPECLYFSDAPSTCRNVSRRLAAEYTRGKYWQ